MPRLSEFRGIVINVYFKDHPPPHLHAIHAGEEVAIEIATGAVMQGSLSPRALWLIREWLELHRSELELSFELAANEEQPGRIEPLP